jgi:cytochrome P450
MPMHPVSLGDQRDDNVPSPAQTAAVAPAPPLYPFGESVGLELHPGYATCRRRETLTRVGLPYGDDAWLVTRHKDIKAVLRDPRFSREVAVRRDEPRLTPLPVNTSVLGLDPPAHSRLRRVLVLALAFNGRTIQRLRDTVTELVERLIDELVDHGSPADLAEHFALPLAGEVGCELLGVPYDDRADLRTWLEGFASTALPVAEVQARMAAMFSYMGELADTRRAEPRDDLVSALLRAQHDDELLSRAELVDVMSDLLLATYDNTSAQLLNAVYILLTFPDQTRLLRQEPELLPQAIEEILRYAPFPSHVTFARYATENVEVGGTLVRAGEAVLAALPSGNRDESVFENASQVDFRRPRNPHLGFGFGLHHCLGGPLVRMEFQVALSGLLNRFPKLSLAVAEQDLPWRSDLLIRRLERLPVTW